MMRSGARIFPGICDHPTGRHGRFGADEVAWLTGKSLAQRLDDPVTVSWINTPVARALHSLSTAQQVAILIDRRIDPDAPINLAVSGEPLGDVLRKIASLLSAGYTQFGPVAYFGPPEVAKNLRTVAQIRLEEAGRLPKQQRDELLKLQSLTWPDLAEPRELLQQLAQGANVQMSGIDALPHDLWRAADLPMLSWIDRVTLLLAQFDLTFQIAGDGGDLRVTPLPRNVTLVRTYNAPRQASALARRWAAGTPRREDLERGQSNSPRGASRRSRARRASPTRRTQAADRRGAGSRGVSIERRRRRVAQVVEQLAARLKLKVTWDRAAIDAAGISVDQLITVHVKDAGLDDLLKAVFDRTGLSFRRTDGAVTVVPAGLAAGKP